jgi:hypothetical protein
MSGFCYLSPNPFTTRQKGTSRYYVIHGVLLVTCEVTGFRRLWTLVFIVWIQQAVLFLWSVTLAARTIIQQLWLNSRGFWPCLLSGCCKSLFMTAEKIKWSLFFRELLTKVLLSVTLFWLGIHTYSLGGFPRSTLVVARHAFITTVFPNLWNLSVG